MAYSSIRLERIRISVLNATTNAPANGASNGYVSDNQVQLQFTPQVQAGTQTTQKNAAGRVCASTTDDDQLSGVDVSLQTCTLDPILFTLLTGGTGFSSTTGGSAANYHGFMPKAIGSSLSQKVCLEAWSDAWDGGSQAISSVTTPNVAYHHFVFPLTRGWNLQQATLASGVTLWTINAHGFDNSAISLNGPFNDWPSYIADEGGVTSCYGVFEDGTIPATSGLAAVPSGS